MCTRFDVSDVVQLLARPGPDGSTSASDVTYVDQSSGRACRELMVLVATLAM